MKALSLFFVSLQSSPHASPRFLEAGSCISRVFPRAREQDAHVGGTHTVALGKNSGHLQQEVVQSPSTHHKVQMGDGAGLPGPDEGTTASARSTHYPRGDRNTAAPGYQHPHYPHMAYFTHPKLDSSLSPAKPRGHHLRSIQILPLLCLKAQDRVASEMVTA